MAVEELETLLKRNQKHGQPVELVAVAKRSIHLGLEALVKRNHKHGQPVERVVEARQLGFGLRRGFD